MMAKDEPEGDTAPCFAHLLVDGYSVDPETAHDVTIP